MIEGTLERFAVMKKQEIFVLLRELETKKNFDLHRNANSGTCRRILLLYNEVNTEKIKTDNMKSVN